VLDSQALGTAVRQTGLGLRSNRPRVYVVCGLAGGTGSGMFLDLAYAVRTLLRQMGYDQPDVVALLLLPAVDASRTRTLALGNAYAALSELIYFATPGTRFIGRYGDRDPVTEDTSPPFGRCVLLPLPDETDEAALREVVGLAGQYLFRDLCSPQGRVADLARAGQSAPPWEARGLYYQTFGLYQLSWPRHALYEAVARRLCAQLVQRWMSKDSKPIRKGVQAWVQERWVQEELGADVFIDRLNHACLKRLGHPPEAAFKAVLQPLLQKYGAGSAPGAKAGGPSRNGAPPPEIPAEELPEALAGLEALLGRPGDEAAPEPHGTVAQVLRESAARLVQAWGQKLAELPVRLIEEPDFRLAGAEEAVRQLVATVEQSLQNHEPLTQELTARAREAFGRLLALAAPPRSGASRRSVPAADVLELLRSYAKWRYQSLVLGQLAAGFVTLRGHLADEMREINFCRVRLTELLRLLEEPALEADRPAGRPQRAAHDRAPAGRPAREIAGRYLFTSGCRDFPEAVETFLAGVTPEALRELDAGVEAMLKERFRALVHVCLSEANVLRHVQAAMLETAAAFAAGLMPQTDVAEMFLDQNAGLGQAGGEVASFFDEAAPVPLWVKPSPDRSQTRPVEQCVLTAPPGPAGDRFRQLAGQVLDGAELLTPTGGPNPADDIVFYREMAHLPLAELEHLGPVCRDAYAQMSSAEHFTPHSRIDIDFKSRKGR
jgi:hypothetical protein